jgi:microcystin-dependent protein
MLGQIMIFAGNFAPRGWAFCDGSLVWINQNTALFSILGTTYGGDGERNFALPDLRSHAPVSGSNYIIAVQGFYPSRD